MKRLFLFTIALAFTNGVFSQNFEVPKNYKFEKAEDYASYEQDVINCVNWLMTTPVDANAAKRKKANSFLLEWVTGCPYVHLEINTNIVSFSSPDLLLIFLGGWTKYSLESKDFEDKIAGTIAGIESVISFYTKNKKTLPKEKNVEKFIKMKGNGSLKEYIEKNS